MNHIKAILLVILTGMATSCSKDNDDKPVTENTYQLLIDKADFDTREIKNNPNELELGYEFRPLTSGKITALVAKLPVAKSGLVVNIWDRSNYTIVRTETFDVLDTDIETVFNIPAFPVQKNHVYAIAMQAKDYYINKYVTNTPRTFPYNCGNIEILGFGAHAPGIYPDVNGINIFFGDIGFKFIKTE